MKISDVPELDKSVTFILNNVAGACIAGSWPLSLFYDFEPNDMDLFIPQNEKQVSMEILEAGGWTLETVYPSVGPPETYIKPRFKSIRMKNLKGSGQVEFLNVIFSPFTRWIDVVGSFDLSICEIAIHCDEEGLSGMQVGELVLETTPHFDALHPVSDDERERMCRPLIVEVDGGPGVYALSECPTTTLMRIHKYAKRGWPAFELAGVGDGVWIIHLRDWGFSASSPVGKDSWSWSTPT